MKHLQKPIFTAISSLLNDYIDELKESFIGAPQDAEINNIEELVRGMKSKYDTEIKKELKVFLVNFDSIINNTFDLNVDDETWIKESERQELVYTLEEFQNTFNDMDNINSFTDGIRFIWVETTE